MNLTRAQLVELLNTHIVGYRGCTGAQHLADIIRGADELGVAAEQPAAPVYGPHCGHDECPLVACDLVAPSASGVLFKCREQARCPHCGPTSPDWPRIVADWLRWCVWQYGTTNSDELRAAGTVPADVVSTAELIEAQSAPVAERPRTWSEQVAKTVGDHLATRKHR